MTRKSCWMQECLAFADWQVSFVLTEGELETDVVVCNRHKEQGAAEVANAMFANQPLVDEIKRQLEPYGMEFPRRGQVRMRFNALNPAPIVQA